jgi:Spy/CpxP family protein refolding chaperone
MRYRRQAWLAVFVVVVFGAGLGTGLLWPHRPRERSSAELVSILGKELDLTPAQRNQMEAVVNARRESLRKFREGVQKHLADERLATIADIERTLTPEQRRRFDAFIASRRDRDGND